MWIYHSQGKSYYHKLQTFNDSICSSTSDMRSSIVELLFSESGIGIHNNAVVVCLVKGRLDCDSWRVFYTTLEATQTRRTDLWVFTLLLWESRLFCVFLFLNGGHLTAGSPLDRCVHQLAKGFQYSYIACLLLMVYGDYLCISIYFWLIELRIDLLLVFFMN